MDKKWCMLNLAIFFPWSSLHLTVVFTLDHDRLVDHILSNYRTYIMLISCAYLKCDKKGSSHVFKWVHIPLILYQYISYIVPIFCSPNSYIPVYLKHVVSWRHDSDNRGLAVFPFPDHSHFRCFDDTHKCHLAYCLKHGHTVCMRRAICDICADWQTSIRMTMRNQNEIQLRGSAIRWLTKHVVRCQWKKLLICICRRSCRTEFTTVLKRRKGRLTNLVGKFAWQLWYLFRWLVQIVQLMTSSN